MTMPTMRIAHQWRYVQPEAINVPDVFPPDLELEAAIKAAQDFINTLPAWGEKTITKVMIEHFGYVRHLAPSQLELVNEYITGPHEIIKA